jgi:hypothetical protein
LLAIKLWGDGYLRDEYRKVIQHVVEEGNSLLLLCMREEEDRDVREKRCTKQRLKEGMQIAFWLFVCMLWLLRTTIIGKTISTLDFNLMAVIYCSHLSH